MQVNTSGGITISVMITDAHHRIALTIARSLGKKGVQVFALNNKRINATFFSRYCEHRFLYSSPSTHNRNFIDCILKIVKRYRLDVLMPAARITMMLLSKHKNKFEPHVKLPIPDFDKVCFASDKAFTLQFAKKHGIPCPETYVVDNLNEVQRISKEIRYPAVIKPRSLGGAQGVTYVSSPADLISKYTLVHRKIQKFPLIQEYITGIVYGVEALFNAKSQPRAVFVHKRLRESPPTGGVSTLRESVHAPEIRDLGLKLLKLLKWYGVAMIEFKLDANDKTPKLMEINPRFWGSLSLAVAAGVDFPYLLYKIAIDGDVKPTFRYKLGIKCRWLSGDVSSFFHTLLYGPNRLKTTRDFIKFYEKNMTYDIEDFEDPAAALGSLIYNITQFLDTRSKFKQWFLQ